MSIKRNRLVMRLVAGVLALGGLLTLCAVLLQPRTAHGEAFHLSNIFPARTAPLDFCPGNAPICQDSHRVSATMTLPGGTAVAMVCWVGNGRLVNGTQKWFYITVPSKPGYDGWVNANFVAHQWLSSPYCYDKGTRQIRGAVASLFSTGLSEIGQLHPTTTDVANALAKYGFPKSMWGPKLDWSGDCVMFTGLSWWNAGQLIHHGTNAAAIARTYTLTKTGIPPRGAAVFWDVGSTGHGAISLGDWWVVTTQGLDNDLLPTVANWVSSLNKRMTYLGWTRIPQAAW